jgi:hypothetical protein
METTETTAVQSLKNETPKEPRFYVQDGKVFDKQAKGGHYTAQEIVQYLNESQEMYDAIQGFYGKLKWAMKGLPPQEKKSRLY